MGLLMQTQAGEKSIAQEKLWLEDWEKVRMAVEVKTMVTHFIPSISIWKKQGLPIFLPIWYIDVGSFKETSGNSISLFL